MYVIYVIIMGFFPPTSTELNSGDIRSLNQVWLFASICFAILFFNTTYKKAKKKNRNKSNENLIIFILKKTKMNKQTFRNQKHFTNFTWLSS